jgi:hypothetical protein
MDGYRIDKLVFESLPGIHVTALVYVPDGPGRKPAVLLACGHSELGKAYRALPGDRGAARAAGYVVLCWDPVGQGERSQFWDRARGRSRYNLVCGEHAVLGNLATLAGTSLVRYMVWDGMRAVDYLLARTTSTPSASPSPARAAEASSPSGWARSTAASVPCCRRASRRRCRCAWRTAPSRTPTATPSRTLRPRVRGPRPPGLLLLAYPRPLHVSAAVLDFFPIEGTRKSMREVADLYRRFGHADDVSLTEGYHKHQYSDENQAHAFAFLDRAFGRPAREGVEAVKTLPPEALPLHAVGPGARGPKGRSLVDVIRNDAPAHCSEGFAGRALSRRGLPGHRELAGRAVRARGPPRRDRLGTRGIGQGGRDRRGPLPHQPQRRLVLPLVHLHREGARPEKLLLRVGLEGKLPAQEVGGGGGPPRRGYDVVSFDARGLGETRIRYRVVSNDDPTLAPPHRGAGLRRPALRRARQPRLQRAAARPTLPARGRRGRSRSPRASHARSSARASSRSRVP